MRRDPIVSICCLTYNQEKYIRHCIDSFLMQKTDFDFEVLINDDASTDGTVEIIEEYAAQYPELIKPIFQKENQYSKGVSMNRSFNFPRAKGEFIAICEGDDYWTDPEKLQKQVEFLKKNPDFGLVYTDIDRVDENNNIIDHFSFRNSLGLHENSLADFLINAWFLAPCTWLFRKSLIDYNVKILPGPGDLQLLLQIAVKSKVEFLHESTANYRILNSSLSHFNTLEEKYFFRKKILDIQLYYSYMFQNSLLEQIKVEFYVTWFDQICEYDHELFLDKTFLFLKQSKKIKIKNKIYYHSRKFKIFRVLKFGIDIYLKIKKYLMKKI